MFFAKAFFVFCIGYSIVAYAQTVSGRVLSSKTQLPLQGITVTVPTENKATVTDEAGIFCLELELLSPTLLHLSLDGYHAKKIPIAPTRIKQLYLGLFLLEPFEDLTTPENLVFLTDAEVDNDEGSVDVTPGVLRSTKNAFLSRASYDFSQVYFKTRGYQANYGLVLINGFRMNKLYNGTPYWGDWGGLNDLTTNQTSYYGLSPVANAFGGLSGTTDIDMHPTEFGKGLKVSSAYSNKTYMSRVMATFHGVAFGRLDYSISASTRFSKEGFFEGTSYNAYALYAAATYRVSDVDNVSLCAMHTTNLTDQVSAQTDEAFRLTSRRYNSFWGYQNGRKRNARVKGNETSTLMLDYRYIKNNLRLDLGVAYQYGDYRRSRLDFINANNPDPLYYKNMPSYYLNLPDLESAKKAKEQFMSNTQLNWVSLYDANSKSLNGQAAYLLYDDRNTDSQWTGKAHLSYALTQNLEINSGVNASLLNAHYFAAIKDFLGSPYHRDVEPFSNTRNNILDDAPKTPKNTLFRYNYNINASLADVFINILWHAKAWDVFGCGALSQTALQRVGHYKNERFLETSLGESSFVYFVNYGLKFGVTYKLSGAHIFSVNGLYQTLAPSIKNVFLNPRDSNAVVSGLADEKVASVEGIYNFKSRFINAELAAYFTDFKDQTNVNFFYASSGLGDDFFQEELTRIGRTHKGLELGIESEVSASVQIDAVVSIGQYLFSNNPNIAVNFNNSGQNFSPINALGKADLGTSKLKNYAVASGPQKAYALGLRYQNPSMWWSSISCNYLTNNYISVSNILRTDSFFKNPEDPNGYPFPEATERKAKTLLKQEMLEAVFLLNFAFGKSWKIKDTYVSLFAVINNLSNSLFKSGGYEQSRLANYRQLYADNAKRTPSFGPKYWLGFGRTVFINLSIRL